MGRYFSDLDLDDPAPVRARPRVGEWGPDLVPTTRRKMMLRVWVGTAFAAGIAAVGALMYLFYRMLMNQ